MAKERRLDGRFANTELWPTGPHDVRVQCEDFQSREIKLYCLASWHFSSREHESANIHVNRAGIAHARPRSLIENLSGFVEDAEGVGYIDCEWSALRTRYHLVTRAGK